MRLYFKRYCFEAELDPGMPLCLCFESPVVYREVVNDIIKQIGGGTGEIIFSEKGKEIQIHKTADLIIDPFSITNNEKKLINSLYQEIDKIAAEELYEDTSRINTMIIGYLDSMIEQIPYPVQYEIELDVASLLKLYKVRFDDSEENLISRLLSYCKLAHRVLRTDRFFFINLKLLMTEAELKEFYRELAYEHLLLLDIEGPYIYHLEGEHCIIIDRDECIIDLV